MYKKKGERKKKEEEIESREIASPEVSYSVILPRRDEAAPEGIRFPIRCTTRELDESRELEFRRRIHSQRGCYS